MGRKPTFFLGWMGMNYAALLEKIERIVEPVLTPLGFELVEREFATEHGRWTVRLYIDREEGGVSVGDCETVSRALEGVLEVENVLPQAWQLEVSSPGLDRPLRRLKDFQRFVGEMIEVQTTVPQEGRRHFKGVLKGADTVREEFFLQTEEKEWHIPLNQLKKARIRFNFGKDLKRRP